MFFVYFYNVNPDDARLIGPYQDHAAALAVAMEDESNDDAAILIIPCEYVEKATSN